MNILQILSNIKKNGPALVVFDLAYGLAEQGHVIYIASAYGELAQQITHPNIHYFHIPTERISGNKLKSIFQYIYSAIRTYYLLKECILENEIDVINSHQPIPNMYAKKLSRKMKIPFVTTSHNVYSRSIMNRTYVSGDYVVAVSEKVLNNSVSLFGVPRNRIVCIRNGINLKRLVIDNPVRFKDKFVIGTVAGLRKQKALDKLIESFAKFKIHYDDSLLIICGEGEKKFELQELVAKLGMQESVLFWGFRDDISNVISSFDVFALSSEYEGLPVSMLEAMALERPVVATSVGGIPEVINNMENGLLIEYGNVEAMAKAFETLYESNDLRNEITRNAYNILKNKYSYIEMAKQYVEIYNKAMERKVNKWY